MSRSIWKGPFVQTSLRKKIGRAKDYIADPTKKGRVRIKTTSRSSTILEDFIGLTFLVHNGKRYQQVIVNSQMVGHKFGEFAFTRQRYFFKKKGKKIK
jgi:small subunit ribosomal protein S19